MTVCVHYAAQEHLSIKHLLATSLTKVEDFVVFVPAKVHWLLIEFHVSNRKLRSEAISGAKKPFRFDLKKASSFAPFLIDLHWLHHS